MHIFKLLGLERGSYSCGHVDLPTEADYWSAGSQLTMQMIYSDDRIYILEKNATVSEQICFRINSSSGFTVYMRKSWVSLQSGVGWVFVRVWNCIDQDAGGNSGWPEVWLSPRSRGLMLKGHGNPSIWTWAFLVIELRLQHFYWDGLKSC